MRILVTGAGGFIGRVFCEMAVGAGHDVVALVRPGSNVDFGNRVRKLYGILPYDVTDAAFDVDHVVHLAAVTTKASIKLADTVNRVGTKYLLSRLDSNRTSITFVSTQSAHSGNNSAYATTKKAAEELIRNYDGIWTIVRPGLVYGPGETGLFGRMVKTLEKLPVMPMLGGGRALVQPIHVADLSEAFLRIANSRESFHAKILSLGMSEEISLKAFLKAVCKARDIKRPFVSIPLGPIKPIVSIAESLKFPLPISSDNLRGLETVERMDTALALQNLDLELRSLESGVKKSDEIRFEHKSILNVLLVGAGKISIVHGLQILNHPKLKLAGVVEPNLKARNFYTSMGFDAEYYDSIEQAVSSGTKWDCAVIATPAFLHYEMAHKCLAAGIHVLVEKPLSVGVEQNAHWRATRQNFPNLVIHSGYMAAQFPHLLPALHEVGKKSLGRLIRARATALQTHITAAEPIRWEMLKNKAGGGALINFGCHVTSMLFRLIGWPEKSAQGWQWSIHSPEVEDVLMARFSIRDVDCHLTVSWSVPGYARPSSELVLEFEKGRIRIENAFTEIVRDGKVARFETQLESGLEFNMSPDYTGAGFSSEYDSFVSEILRKSENGHSAGTKRMPAVEINEALRLEAWIFETYSSLRPGKPEYIDLLDQDFDPELSKTLLSLSPDSK